MIEKLIAESIIEYFPYVLNIHTQKTDNNIHYIDVSSDIHNSKITDSLMHDIEDVRNNPINRNNIVNGIICANLFKGTINHNNMKVNDIDEVIHLLQYINATEIVDKLKSSIRHYPKISSCRLIYRLLMGTLSKKISINGYTALIENYLSCYMKSLIQMSFMLSDYMTQVIKHMASNMVIKLKTYDGTIDKVNIIIPYQNSIQSSSDIGICNSSLSMISNSRIYKMIMYLHQYKLTAYNNESSFQKGIDGIMGDVIEYYRRNYTEERSYSPFNACNDEWYEIYTHKLWHNMTSTYHNRRHNMYNQVCRIVSDILYEPIMNCFTSSTIIVPSPLYKTMIEVVYNDSRKHLYAPYYILNTDNKRSKMVVHNVTSDDKSVDYTLYTIRKMHIDDIKYRAITLDSSQSFMPLINNRALDILSYINMNEKDIKNLYKKTIRENRSISQSLANDKMFAQMYHYITNINDDYYIKRDIENQANDDRFTRNLSNYDIFRELIRSVIESVNKWIIYKKDHVGIIGIIEKVLNRKLYSILPDNIKRLLDMIERRYGYRMRPGVAIIHRNEETCFTKSNTFRIYNYRSNNRNQNPLFVPKRSIMPFLTYYNKIDNKLHKNLVINIESTDLRYINIDFAIYIPESCAYYNYLSYKNYCQLYISIKDIKKDQYVTLDTIIDNSNSYILYVFNLLMEAAICTSLKYEIFSNPFLNVNNFIKFAMQYITQFSINIMQIDGNRGAAKRIVADAINDAVEWKTLIHLYYNCFQYVSNSINEMIDKLLSIDHLYEKGPQSFIQSIGRLHYCNNMHDGSSSESIYDESNYHYIITSEGSVHNNYE